MDQVILRTANATDLERLLKFEQSMIDFERPFDDTIRSDGDVRYYDIEELISSSDVQLIVAELNSEMIGSGYARIERSESYLKHRCHSYLGFMYVVPEHRGKGINRMIIDELEAWSRSKGVTEMQLEVYSDNAGAIRAYEKSGYKRLIIQMRKGLTNKD